MQSMSFMSAVNRTRGSCLAEQVRVANTHWTRLRGLIGVPPSEFQSGKALWIVPCHGVHTLLMRFPIDLIYLDRDGSVIELHNGVKPWRVAPVRISAASVLELPAGTVRDSATEVGDRIEIVASEKSKEAVA